MKFLLTFLTVIFVLTGGRSACAFEHSRYDLDVYVNTDEKEIKARQTVVFTNNSGHGVNEIFFHIYANRHYTEREKEMVRKFGAYFKVDPYPSGFEESRVTFSKVSAGGRDVEWEITGDDRTLLRLPLSTVLGPGEQVTVEFEFEVNIPHAYGRFGWHDGIFKLTQWYPVLAVLDEKGWSLHPFYPYHRPFHSEAAHYNVKLDVPAGQVVIHSGVEKDRRQKDGRQEITIESGLPIREFTAAMSPRYQVVTGTFQDTEIRSYYLPGRESFGKLALEDARDMMEFYSKRLGDYPYPVFSIAPVPLGYGGEQMSNLIFLDTRLYELPGFMVRYFDFLVAHETGHQWFYNMIGVDEYKEMWLEEGINSYFLIRYLEDKYGEGAEVLDLPEWAEGAGQWLLPRLTFEQTRDFRYKTLMRQGDDHAIISGLSTYHEPSNIFSITYGKGARVLGMLKAYIGGEDFDRLFARIGEEYRYRILSLDDFMRMAEEASEKELDGFFEQWLFSAQYLDYAVDDVRPGEVVLSNRGEASMPVPVEVVFADGQTEEFIWNGTKPREVVRLENASGIVQVNIDPREEWLDIDRVNNHWPRIVHFQPVAVYWPLYDIAVFMEADAYNWILGPELANNGIGVKTAFHKPYDQGVYAATDVELGEQLWHSRAGYQISNVFNSRTILGFEVENTDDYDDGSQDEVEGKIYLRKELSASQFGFFDINSHVTFYVLRSEALGDGADLNFGSEDTRNIDYRERDEAIVGTQLYLNKATPYPAPNKGYRLTLFAENGGHFLGAGEFFYRGGTDVSYYYPVTRDSNLAFRIKLGLGYPDDKELFFLGGIDGLRGYKRKSIRGANALLGSVEYRFPIVKNINAHFLDNIFGIEEIGGAVFFDAGQAWFSDFDGGRLRKDAGAGLWAKVSILSLFEQVIVRVDVADAINDSSEDPRLWLTINHAF